MGYGDRIVVGIAVKESGRQIDISLIERIDAGQIDVGRPVKTDLYRFVVQYFEAGGCIDRIDAFFHGMVFIAIDRIFAIRGM